MHRCGRAARRALIAGALAPALGCTTPQAVLAPFDPPPASCEAIDREMEELAGEVAERRRLDTGRDVTMTAILLAVAVEAINPAFALLPPIVGAIEIETKRDEERLRFLANAKLHRGCF